MRRDSRLSGVLHVLLHMAERTGPATSEMLAKAMDTNPVVIRRIMAGLRDQGYVRSEKGHGGGWTLACDLSKVTLRDIYTALGSPVASRHGQPDGGARLPRRTGGECRPQPGIRRKQRRCCFRVFGEVTLAMLSADLHERLVARGGSHRLEICHAA